MSYIDIAILVLIAACGLLGFFRGFFKSLIAFCGFIVSVLLVFFIAKPVANAMLDITAVGNWVAGADGGLFNFVFSKFPEGLEQISTAEIAMVYAAEGEAGVKELFTLSVSGGGVLSEFFMSLCYPLVQSALINPTYLASGIETARQIVAIELSFGIFTVIVGVCLFFAIRLLVAILSILFRNIGANPSVTMRFLGFIVGAAKGALYTVIIFLAISFLPAFDFMDKYNEQLDKSMFADKVSEVSLAIAEKAFESKPDDVRYEKLVEIYLGEDAPVGADDVQPSGLSVAFA